MSKQEMESRAADQFSALGNTLRLECFRYVIAAGDEGRAAGEIARALGVAPSTLSSHLAVLQHSGLLTRRRDRQRIIYAVDAEAIKALVAFLLDDCCGGRPELCGIALPSDPAERAAGGAADYADWA
jgi:ArsR family transcriptional regulator, arsenate/arsenite/antimonite-responsive transcriptional repressor